MKLFHGTNQVLSELLPPCDTGNQRELRSRNLGVVFATSDFGVALRYAQDAAKRLGGSPVVLEVTGDFRPWKNKPGCTIFIAPSAQVVGIRKEVRGNE